MRLPLLLVPSGSLPPFQRWRLADSLYASRRPLLFGTAAMVALGLLCWLRSNSPWFLVWDALVLIVLFVRLVYVRRYLARDLETSPEYWARRYLAAVAAYAVLWSLILLSVPLLPHDPFIHFIVVAIMAGYNGGGPIRNSPSPLTVAVGSMVPAVTLTVACLATGSLYYTIFAIFPAVQIITDLDFGARHGRGTLALLAAEREQASLYERLLETCGELETAIGQLSELSTTDELTGIANRRNFTTVVESAWRLAVRQKSELSLLLVDVDHFKFYNDRFGHPEGDRCLCTVAHTLRDGVREGDLVARYGGEEFVVLLPQTGPAEAGEVAERLRAAVEARAVSHPGSPLGTLTISIGLATVVPQPGDEPARLVSLADGALYGAKRHGRNRVAVAAAEDIAAV